MTGPNAIIRVDLETGKSRRKLNDDSSTKAADNFKSIVEGPPFMNCPKNGKPSSLTVGVDGIAISSNGEYLYYCPLASRRLYRIKTDKLLDESLSEADVARAVEDLGRSGFASDGLESDVENFIYLTDYEHNAIIAQESRRRLWKLWSPIQHYYGRILYQWLPTDTCMSSQTNSIGRNNFMAETTDGKSHMY